MIVLSLFLFSRLLVILSAQVAWSHFAKAETPNPLPAHERLDDLFYRADAVWYTCVARDHYYYWVDASGGVNGNVAFFPVFPWLMRAAHYMVPDWPLAGHLVANVMLLIACFLLWELAELELRSRTAAAWALAFMLLCPGTAWFSMIFSESTFLLLFLVLILGCRRRHWWVVAAAGYLLALTRVVGILACLFVALEALSEWLERRRAGGVAPTPGEYARWLLAAAAPALGHASFLLSMQVYFGDWRAQHNVLVSGWPQNAHPVAPWTAFLREIAPMHTGKWVIIYGLLLGGIALSALSLRALRRPSYPVVAFALLFIYVTAANHSPMARYLSVVVPVHLTLAWIATRVPWLGGALMAASAGLMCLITGLMVNGYVFY